MAKKIYTGIGNVAREVDKSYLEVEKVARTVTRGYIGVDNVSRQCYSADIPVGELEIGSSVYISINGVPTEFFVVHQGLPDAEMYDNSCDGTWLLMRDIYNLKPWTTDAYPDNARVEKNYSVSTIHQYLNTSFLDLIDNGVQAIIRQAIIPYGIQLSSTKSEVFHGPNGVPAKIFLLSYRELKELTTGSTFAKDGVRLAYFVEYGASVSSTADDSCVAYYNGEANAWWTRSGAYDAECVMSISKSGASSPGGQSSPISKNHGVRPALILPSEVLVDYKFNVIT